ncbi:MAG: hypothetical protein QG599_282 [Pseudomonadota bacterium]|nr:hypothetical protein [Pseudomonadota bacterium]
MSDLNSSQRLSMIHGALADFAGLPLEDAATAFFAALGYQGDRTQDGIGHNPDEFLAHLPESFNRERAHTGQWRRCAFLFQLTNEEIPLLAVEQRPLVTATRYARDDIESFTFLALELTGESWSRTALAAITREFNRAFAMPAIMLFKCGGLLSLAVIDRRLHLRDASREVLDSRITVIKDVRYADPHRAHLDILAGLAFANLGERHRPGNFWELYDAWIAALSIQALNKDFYTKLAHWYFWAIKQVRFPQGGGADPGKRHAIAVIRLLTRLIFVWFVKEKGLIPPALFDRARLRELLKDDPEAHPEAGHYYLAILQNLFFATLNVETGTDEQEVRPRRRWASENKSGGQTGHYLITSVYRHKELFKDPEAALALFSTIPFLNGGLFECLDRPLIDQDFQRNPELQALAVKEGKGWVLRVDGFSRRKDAQAMVPNKLFFGGDPEVDLNADLGTKGKRYAVRGLLDLFNSYKFTVDENMPLEEEVALDPELLGKVFENLLASYNEDTQTTARKQSGSFYTPREVVDYMVDEALIAYFERHLSSPRPLVGERSLQSRLRRLLSYAEDDHDFSPPEVMALIAAIERLKVLDPACGSGAFPMGMLHKLVHVLKKLDRNNVLWRQQNRTPLEAQLAEARKIPDLTLREERVVGAEVELEKFDRDFANTRHADYTRKLYLIQKCIHGVDIQPIAVQIAKLRFFIALMVSQEVDTTRPNSGVTALPNLETKIVAADTLTPIDRPAQGGLQDPSIKEKQQDIMAARDFHFAARTRKTKYKWQQRISDFRVELAEFLEKDRFLPEGAAKYLAHWNQFDQNAAADFFDPEWMFQIGDGFDIVIGNPPYVRQEKLKAIKDLLKKHYDCFTGTADLYVYFYERSIKLLKPEGVFAFITSNKWYRANYGEKLRDWMNRHTQIRSIIDFGDEAVFTAIAYPTIIIATRRKLPSPASGRRVGGEGGKNAEIVRVMNWSQKYPVEIFPEVFAKENFSIPQNELRKEGWQLEPPVKRRLLERIRSAGKPLGEYVQGHFYRGITTGLNEAFVIDGETRQTLIDEDPKSTEIIKPFLRGKDLKKWRLEYKNLWLISSRRGIDIKQYFSVFNYLHKFIDQLEPKSDNWDENEDGLWKGRKPGSYEWYEIQDNTAYWQDFEKQKIVYPDIALSPQFSWDSDKRYIANTGYIIPTNDKWLLAILNSSVCAWFYAQISPQIQNGYYRFIAQYCGQIPIPDASPNQKRFLEFAVSAILNALTPNPSPACERGEWERLINGLVYELFFPEDLHQANIHFFDTVAKAGIDRLADLDGTALADAARELADTIFAPSHPIQGMFSDLQRLDVVRIIEGRD